MVDVANVVGSLLAFLPSMGLLFASYGRWDGEFRDNVVFLHLIGGMLFGILAAVFLAWFLAYGLPVAFALSFALVTPLATTAVVNRKWQGERHAVFNGGAQGAGGAAVVTLMLERGSFELAAGPILSVVGTGLAIAALFMANGLLLGAHIAQRRAFRGMALAALAALPVGALLFEYLRSGAWLWLLLALLACGGYYAWADRALLPRGVSDEGRKRARRRWRAQAR